MWYLIYVKTIYHTNHKSNILEFIYFSTMKTPLGSTIAINYTLWDDFSRELLPITHYGRKPPQATKH